MLHACCSTISARKNRENHTFAGDACVSSREKGRKSTRKFRSVEINSAFCGEPSRSYENYTGI